MTTYLRNILCFATFCLFAILFVNGQFQQPMMGGSPMGQGYPAGMQRPMGAPMGGSPMGSPYGIQQNPMMGGQPQQQGNPNQQQQQQQQQDPKSRIGSALSNIKLQLSMIDSFGHFCWGPSPFDNNNGGASFSECSLVNSAANEIQTNLKSLQKDLESMDSKDKTTTTDQLAPAVNQLLDAAKGSKWDDYKTEVKNIRSILDSYVGNYQAQQQQQQQQQPQGGQQIPGRYPTNAAAPTGPYPTNNQYPISTQGYPATGYGYPNNMGYPQQGYPNAGYGANPTGGYNNPTMNPGAYGQYPTQQGYGYPTNYNPNYYGGYNNPNYSGGYGYPTGNPYSQYPSSYGAYPTNYNYPSGYPTNNFNTAAPTNPTSTTSTATRTF
ncbi:hypothetical protein ABK040_005839 [Willaertia magna]